MYFLIFGLLMTAPRRGRYDFVRVQYALWVHGAFQTTHQVDGLSALRLLQVTRFHQPDAVLRANAATTLGRPAVHESFDRTVRLFVVLRRHDVQMQITVTCNTQSHPRY